MVHSVSRPVASAYPDTFARDHLPPPEEWPELRFDLPELRYPDRVNAARELLDEAIRAGMAERVAVMGGDTRWTYGELADRVDRIAHVLRQDMALIPGNRVLLRGVNAPMMFAAWLAVLKAGGIVVATMPMLRAGEIAKVIDKAQIDFALCDRRAVDELNRARQMTGRLRGCFTYGDGDLEHRMNAYPRAFTACDTACEDVALLAFTSGTTGEPKATIHFHRDVLVMADIVGGRLLGLTSEDVVCGSPPLGFTFGVGALLVFPLRFRAASLLIEKPTPEELLNGIRHHGVTALFTAPTAYHNLLSRVAGADIHSLRLCVSAGEPLPKLTSDVWFLATGLRIVDGIGATEMTHIFISAAGEAIRPGATGRALPGYEACVLDEAGLPLPPGQVGRLAVKGPTGCRYLADPRQREYVQRGWNVTGDLYRVDEDGYYWFEARGDDMIVSSGYNIAGPEVEAALLQHPSVRECGVVGVPDPMRGTIVKAYVVLHAGVLGSAQLVDELQRFAKDRIAPFKYPRAIEFLDELPKTPTGKIRRSVLRGRNSADAFTPGNSAPG